MSFVTGRVYVDDQHPRSGLLLSAVGDPVHPSCSFTGPPAAGATFQRVQQLAGEGRIREAAETFLRFAASYRPAGTAFDTFDPALRESLLANAATMLTELHAGTGEELTVDQLRRITCPVTCLVGDLTPHVIADGTDRLVRLMRHDHVTRITGAAHAMHIDQSDRFVDDVRSPVIMGV